MFLKDKDLVSEEYKYIYENNDNMNDIDNIEENKNQIGNVLAYRIMLFKVLD